MTPAEAGVGTTGLYTLLGVLFTALVGPLILKLIDRKRKKPTPAEDAATEAAIQKQVAEAMPISTKTSTDLFTASLTEARLQYATERVEHEATKRLLEIANGQLQQARGQIAALRSQIADLRRARTQG